MNLEKNVTNKNLNKYQTVKVPPLTIEKIVTQALTEDIGPRDITAQLIHKNHKGFAQVITRQNMVLCGADWVTQVFKKINPTITIRWFFGDGDIIKKNKILFEIKGCTKDILSGERVALNFLQMLSAVATKTQHYVNKIAHTKAKIIDTRKTIPGFRIAQKYAVHCGGGTNHRIGLFDGILIKENHIAASDYSIIKAVNKARKIHHDKKIEVEVETYHQLQDALIAKADIIMLDNFKLSQIKKAVCLINKKAIIEVSGNYILDNIIDIAETEIDFISSGDLTKNIEAIDLSMRFTSESFR